MFYWIVFVYCRSLIITTMPFVQKTIYSDPSVDYHNYAVDVRGTVINAVAEMEEAMENGWLTG